MQASIIITNHNYGRFLDRAIKSSLDQVMISGEDVEVIVVEDGSTDGSKEIVESYDEQVRGVFHDEAHGLPAAVNAGIQASKGSNIIRLDADDWLDLHAVFFLNYFLDQNPEIGFVWPDYHIYDSNEKLVNRISEPQGAGIMFRRQLLLDVGLYDEEMLMYEDRDILFRCAAKSPGYHLKMPLYCYSRHADNMSDKHDELLMFENRLNEKHGTASQANVFTINPGSSGPN